MRRRTSAQKPQRLLPTGRGDVSFPFLGVAILLIGLWFIGARRPIFAILLQNRQFIAFNRTMATNVGSGLDSNHWVTFPSGNYVGPDQRASSSRLVGHRYLMAGNREAARLAFNSAGWTERDYVAMSTHFKMTNPDWAIAWLAMAVASEPTESATMISVGELCRKDWEQDEICRAFLRQNQGNHFVNSDFGTGDLTAWQMAESIAQYDIDYCPDKEGLTCAKIGLMNSTAQPPAGLGQCFHVHPGKTYRFSAWLKVDASSNAAWRPLYYQGTVNGEPKGSWLGDQHGPREWEYWEREFVAPKFDEYQGCFSPIRLINAGKAWFFDSQVREISGNE